MKGVERRVSLIESDGAPESDFAQQARRALGRAFNLIGALDSKLSYAETDRRELATRLVLAESQMNRLTTLYVATYQLHSTLDPAAVIATVADIAINLLAAESFALLLRGGSAAGFEIAVSEGTLDWLPDSSSPGHYGGGERLVDRALAEGIAAFGPTADSLLLAALPLMSQGEVAGALIVRKLLDHHQARLEDDRELLDLLAAHAASALLAARAYAAHDRKVRTLESLIRLARGPAGIEEGR